MAVPMGSAARVLLEVGNVAQLRFGWQAWHFVTVRRVPYCNVSKVVLCDRRNTFASFSEDEFHLSWQAQHFGRVHLHYSRQVQHFRRVVLRAFCESQSRAASSGANVQIAWQAWDAVRVSFCVAGAVFSVDPLCVECHFAWQAQYLGHSTLYTPHTTPSTPQFTLYTCHSPP